MYGRVDELMLDKRLLECEHPWDEISSYAYHSLNIAAKKEVEKIVNKPIPKIDMYMEEIKEEVDEFYANPKHWSNNKRRRNNMPALRGKLNKCRRKTYHATPAVFYLIEDLLDDMLVDGFENYYNSFAEIGGVANEYSV